jgi:hypothetical protein
MRELALIEEERAAREREEEGKRFAIQERLIVENNY